MMELIDLLDLAYGTCIVGEGIEGIIGPMSRQLVCMGLKPLALDLPNGPEAIEEVDGRVWGAHMLSNDTIDLFIESLASSLELDDRGRCALSMLVNRFFRTSPSPTLFGLTGFLDSVEVEDRYVRGIAERVKELTVTVSSNLLGEKGASLKSLLKGAKAFSFERAAWPPQRRLLYATALMNIGEHPELLEDEAVVVLYRPDRWLDKRIYGYLRERLLGRVPLLAFCREKIEGFRTYVLLDGWRFEVRRPFGYRAKGLLRIRPYRSSKVRPSNRVNLEESREAYEILKVLAKGAATLEGLAGYLSYMGGEEYVKSVALYLKGHGLIGEEEGRLRITEAGKELLSKLVKDYEGE
jgi:hypothetical protein